MTVHELIQNMNLEVLSCGADTSVMIEGCFSGDLLSLAMSNIEAGNVWVTVQTNVNILGIAALTETSCVIVANGMNVPDPVVQKAIEEKICLLRTPHSAYEVCCMLGERI